MLRSFLVVTSLLGISAIVIGTIGAHVLELDAATRLSFDTASRYHYYHLLAMLGVVALMMRAEKTTWLVYAFGAFLVGILLFSCCIYIPVFMGWGPDAFLRRLPPFGGMSFILGWVFLGIHAFYIKKPTQ